MNLFFSRYKFNVEESFSSSVPNNNSNIEVNHYAVSRSNENVVKLKSFKSQLYLENKNTSINPGKDIQYKLHLPNCNRNSSLQSDVFSSPVKKKLIITGVSVLR